ncbi:MAG: hypothetical protein H0U71_08245 [Gammaproteobacteria bacterium]|nr:hypothetical protein [Gammaproteobacteria bacterium]
MSKLTRYIQSYLLFGFPFVVTAILWDPSKIGNGFIGFTQKFLSGHLVFWFSVLTLFLIMLVIVPNVREITLRRLANIKERDEREEHITGKASRVTYISTLSLLLLLFFYSIFSVNIKTLPENQTYHGKHRVASLNLGFSIFEEKNKNDPKEGFTLFDSKNMSLSTASILLILIAWQLIIFNYVARKEQIKSIK